MPHPAIDTECMAAYIGHSHFGKLLTHLAVALLTGPLFVDLVFAEEPDALLLLESVDGVLSTQIDTPLAVVVEQQREVVAQAGHLAYKFGLSVDPLEQVPHFALAVLRRARVAQLLLLRHSAGRLLNLLHFYFVLNWLQVEVHVVFRHAFDSLFGVHSFDALINNNSCETLKLTLLQNTNH